MYEFIKRVTLISVGVMFIVAACGRENLQVEDLASTPTVLATVPPERPGDIEGAGDEVTDDDNESLTTVPPPLPTEEETEEAPEEITSGWPEGDSLVEAVPQWEDLADPVAIGIESIGVQALIEPTTRNAKGEFNPSGPAVGWIYDYGVGPCEIGATWLMGHSHGSGALHGLVVHPQDTADQDTTHNGVQAGDDIVIALNDGHGCRYQVQDEFHGDTPTATVPDSVSGTSALSWPKASFVDEQRDSSLPHPHLEWLRYDGEAALFLSTSGGWPIVNGHRPNLDTVFAIMVESW